MTEITKGTIKEFKSVEHICEQLLAEDERCRNDDLWLMLQGYQRLGFKIYIDYKDIPNMPRPETWKRVRAKIQNKKHRFLPTIDSVARNRRVRQKAIERYVTM